MIDVTKPLPKLTTFLVNIKHFSWNLIYSDRNEVICYEGANLKTIVSRRKFKGDLLSLKLLSTVSPNRDVLFWLGGTYDEDQKIEVKQLHCHDNGYLYFKKAKTPIDLPDDSIIDMCCISGGRSLLFVTEDGLVACNTKTGKQKWSASLNQPDLKEEMCIDGITTDAQGHLFVCDTKNECVHVFSENNAQHLGILLKKKDGDIGVPHKVGWNHKSGLLVVTHKQDDSRFIVSIYKLRK